MTPAEIIAMAKEAGMQPNEDPNAVSALGKSVPFAWVEKLVQLATVRERDILAANIHSAIHGARYHQSDPRLSDFSERVLLDLLDEIGPRSK